MQRYNLICVCTIEDFCTILFVGAHAWRPIVFETFPTKSLDDYTPILHHHKFRVNRIVDSYELTSLNIFLDFYMNVPIRIMELIDDDLNLDVVILDIILINYQ